MVNATERKKEILAVLENQEISDRFTALFGNKKDKEAFAASLVTMSLQDNLLQCSLKSIINAALSIASLKLSLNKNLGKAYIVPRRIKGVNVAHFELGYKGWLELAYRSKLGVSCYPVFQCDSFSFKIVNANEELNLEPNFELRNESDVDWVNKNLRGIVIVIRNLKLNISNIEFVSVGTLNKIMQMNESVKRGSMSAYSTWLIEMLKAKAIKYVVSKTAMSEELGNAVALENQEYKEEFENFNKKLDSKVNKTNTTLNSLLLTDISKTETQNSDVVVYDYEDSEEANV